MRFRKFKITNFKGVQSCALSISENTRIVPIIGLNESGKTTILDALSRLATEDLSSHLYGARAPTRPATDIVPKHRKANFTDTVEIETTVSISHAEKLELAEHFKTTHDLILEVGPGPEEFTITHTLTFKNSVHTQTNNLWGLWFNLKRPAQRKYTTYGSEEKHRVVWLSGIMWLQKRLPKILYFPDFLVDIPSKIYLRAHPKESKTNRFYREVISDIFSSSQTGLTLKEHVLDRLDAARSRSTDETWNEDFFKSDERQQINSVFYEISRHLTKEIFEAWSEVFGRAVKDVQLELEWGLDTNGEPYLGLAILERGARFQVHERSLGFRWFFCFLLFAYFRAARKDDASILLLDEPASNLHAKAQMQIVRCLPVIAGTNNVILYSTHSHYMIEPAWLENAYIVENKAIEYDGSDEGPDYYSTADTDIIATRYREFVGRHPNRVSYFQPILDRLQYAVAPLIGQKDALLVEGKYDFYAIRAAVMSSGQTIDVDVMPCLGAETCDALIGMLLGWGRKFVLLLDDDEAGRIAKARYIDEYCLPPDAVLTLGDALPSLVGKKFEALFSPEFRNEAKAHFGALNGPTKKQLAQYCMELCQDEALKMEAKTTQAIMELVEKATRNLRPTA